MKTILEISTKQDTSYAMPDWLYPVIARMLTDPMNRTGRSPYGRSNTPSVAEVVNMLPVEVRALVEIKPVAKPEPQHESRGPWIYLDESAEDVWDSVPEYVKKRYARAMRNQ